MYVLVGLIAWVCRVIVDLFTASQSVFISR